MDLLPFVPPFLFGLALQRGRVHESQIVFGQMTFSHFVMLKMFLSALGSSCLVHAYHFKSTNTTDEEKEKLYQRPNRGFVAAVSGAAFVGVGMALSGSCPGTVYAQLGALSWLAIPISIGSLAGAFVFEQYVEKMLTSAEGGNFLTKSPLPQDQNALYKVLNRQFELNLTAEDSLTYMGAGLLGMVGLLELVINWKSDLSTLYPNTYQDLSLFAAQPALLSGLMIGAAQYISLTYNKKALGCSYTFVEFLQMGFSALKPRIQTISPQCKDFCENTCDSISKPQQSPSPVTAYGIIAGALVGTLATGSFYIGRGATDFPTLGAVGSGIGGMIFLTGRVFVGGFLSLLGARIAGGCTSGVGLSYASTGSTTGLSATASMFGAAIVAGSLMKAIFG